MLPVTILKAPYYKGKNFCADPVVKYGSSTIDVSTDIRPAEFSCLVDFIFT